MPATACRQMEALAALQAGHRAAAQGIEGVAGPLSEDTMIAGTEQPVRARLEAIASGGVGAPAEVAMALLNKV